ncbi:hypothetical protein ACTJI5_10700 [Sphingopyxis sp. 22461]
MPAIDVPPNFITIRAMSPRFLNLVSAATFPSISAALALLGKGAGDGKAGIVCAR